MLPMLAKESEIKRACHKAQALPSFLLSLPLIVNVFISYCCCCIVLYVPRVVCLDFLVM